MLKFFFIANLYESIRASWIGCISIYQAAYLFTKTILELVAPMLDKKTIEFSNETN